MSQKNSLNVESLPSSFRDPDSFLFERNGVLYRQINLTGMTNYKKLMDSGLYGHLVRNQLLVDHEVMPNDYSYDGQSGVIIRPKKIEFISYPYEWCFSQMKDAALLTLEIVLIAMEYGMTLKDASAYNIQFINGKPIFIDTGSFEEYIEGEPWTAYQQFCKHFLAPLALISMCDVRMGGLSKQYIDGIPLDLASRLLPLKSWFKYSLLTHIHIHSKFQSKYSDSGGHKDKKTNVSAYGMRALIDSLRMAVKGIRWKQSKTEWGDYYNITNYSDQATEHKCALIEKFVNELNPKTIWDMGGNNGFYSRVAAKYKASTVCWDIDPVAVESNYCHAKEQSDEIILPLLQDLTNPSPYIGWANCERESLIARGPVDLVMALALVHHLAISNNVPLLKIINFFSALGKYLIIEFVPKSDSQVKKLLSSREDIFGDYTIENFIDACHDCYEIVEKVQVRDSERVMFLLKKKENRCLDC